MVVRNMCKMCVWTAQAWSDCMYTLPEKRPEMELKIMFFYLFGDFFLGGAKLLPRGVHGVPRGRPGVPKGRPGRARCRRWPAKKCQRDATESKRLPRGTKRLPRQCPMLPIGFQSVLKGCPGIPKGRTETKSRAKEPSDKHGTTNRQRLGQGENLRWMPPRCVPDASQMPPRCITNASQMPPRNPAP